MKKKLIIALSILFIVFGILFTLLYYKIIRYESWAQITDFSEILDKFYSSWWYALLVAIGTIAINKIRKWNNNRRIKLINYGPEELAKDYLYEFNSWTENRILNEEDCKVLQKKQDKYTFIKKYDKMKEFNEFVKQFKKNNEVGAVCYLVDYNIDFREAPENQTFKITVNDSDYSEACAVDRLIVNNLIPPEDVIKQIKNDPKKYLSEALPTNITMNLVVLLDNKFLAVRRSKQTSTAKNIWTVGGCETLKKLDVDKTSGAGNPIFKLVARGMQEEFNIPKKNYSFFISWFGFFALRAHIVTIVRIKDLTENQVIELVQKAESKYEFTQLEWLPFKYKMIKSFIESNNYVFRNREWLHFSKLSLYEAYRLRNMPLNKYC